MSQSKAGAPRLARSKRVDNNSAPPQLGLFEQPDPLRQRIEELDVSVLTPLEALNKLDELKKLL